MWTTVLSRYLGENRKTVKLVAPVRRQIMIWTPITVIHRAVSYGCVIYAWHKGAYVGHEGN